MSSEAGPDPPPAPILPPVLADIEDLQVLTEKDVKQRAGLMESIRSTGGLGSVKLRSPAESLSKQREREAARALATGSKPKTAGRGDLMRDLSAQLKQRGGARPGQLLRRGKR